MMMILIREEEGDLLLVGVVSRETAYPICSGSKIVMHHVNSSSVSDFIYPNVFFNLTSM